MKRTESQKRVSYQPPYVAVLEFSVENGIAQSDGRLGNGTTSDMEGQNLNNFWD